MITVLGAKVQRAELDNIPLVRPDNAGPCWRGIQHGELARLMETSLHVRGIEITNQLWSVERDGASLVGGLDVKFPKDYDIPNIPGMNYSLGISHTNDMKRALKFAAGGKLLVCGNGLITGEVILHRKHTIGLSLPEEIDNSIDRYIEEARHVKSTVDKMKSRHINDKTASHKIIQAARQRLIPWSHLSMVDREWRNPSHEEFKPRTSWSLFNAFTERAVKYRHPNQQLHALSEFRKIVLN